MERIGDIEETFKKLSKVNVDFIEFVKKNPASLKNINFKHLESNPYSYKLQSWPTFINRQTKKIFQEAGAKVFDLIKSIPARLFNNNPKRIADYFEQPETVVNLQLEGIRDDYLANMVGRMDFTFSTSELKCLEFNVTVGTSGWQLPEWEALYLNIPIIDKFLKEYHVKINNENYPGLFLEHMTRFAECMATPPDNAGNTGKPGLNVVVVTQDYIEDLQEKCVLLEDLREMYKKILSTKDLSGDVFMCDFHALECIDNKVYYKGHRIHGVIELFHGFLPPILRKAYLSGNIRLLNGPVTGLLSNKLNLALLSENEDSDVFSHEEKETIKKHIPWTRKIIPGETFYHGEKIEMPNFLIANKNKLVIKPPMGLGGHQVCIGQGTFRKDWEFIVNTAFKKRNFLVQELLDAPSGLYQLGEDGCAYHDTIWGVWIMGSRYGASFVRVKPRGNARKVVNAENGAEISVVFEVDE